MSDKAPGASQERFQFDSMQDAEKVVAYLRAIADGIERHRLALGVDGKTAELHPQGLMRVRVAARKGAFRSRLEVKMSWREDHGREGQPPATLDIS